MAAKSRKNDKNALSTTGKSRQNKNIGQVFGADSSRSFPGTLPGIGGAFPGIARIEVFREDFDADRLKIAADVVFQ